MDLANLEELSLYGIYVPQELRRIVLCPLPSGLVLGGL